MIEKDLRLSLRMADIGSFIYYVHTTEASPPSFRPPTAVFADAGQPVAGLSLDHSLAQRNLRVCPTPPVGRYELKKAGSTQ
jgi:hypothetical protein